MFALVRTHVPFDLLGGPGWVNDDAAIADSRQGRRLGYRRGCRICDSGSLRLNMVNGVSCRICDSYISSDGAMVSPKDGLDPPAAKPFPAELGHGLAALCNGQAYIAAEPLLN